MSEAAHLPIIDLSIPDRLSTAGLIRQACTEYGFFYLVNHGVEDELVEKVFQESRKFFSLPLDEKMKLYRKEHRGYTPLYAEKLDTSSTSKGDSKESFYIGPLDAAKSNLNQWPSQVSWNFNPLARKLQSVLHLGEPSWNVTMRKFSLALNLEEDYFEKIGALDEPECFLRLLHYPGEHRLSDEGLCGASAHSDYGMITLLATDGVPGLQVCREKFNKPWAWEYVLHMKGAFIVNIGDMMERWTNCLFRSTLHRVMPEGRERYSLAFFLDPNSDCIVECLESCYNESCPKGFPPIRSGDYLKERLRLTYGF